MATHPNLNASRKAREIAARLWCDDAMKDVPMDVDAAERIALIVDKVLTNVEFTNITKEIVTDAFSDAYKGG